MSPGKEKTIAVIGAGIIGVTLARKLQREGWRVLLFDPGEPGMGASFGNAGFIATDEILPLSHGISFSAVFKMLLNPMAPLTIRWQNIFSLIPWFWKFLQATRPNPMAKSAAALAALQKGALKAWNTTIREEALTPHIRKNGAMIVYETEKGFHRQSWRGYYWRNAGQKATTRGLAGPVVRSRRTWHGCKLWQRWFYRYRRNLAPVPRHQFFRSF